MATDRFDFARYNKLLESDDGPVYTEPDGTRVEMMGGEVPVVREIFPAPFFEELYKEYYADGALKTAGRFVGSLLKIGVWREYGPSGEILREVDEDKKFGAFKPAALLDLLEREGHINRRSGKGRDKVIISFGRDDNLLNTGNARGLYSVELQEGARNEAIPKIGEPSLYSSVILTIDGETGKILKKEKR